jgi:cytosine permease
VPVQLFNAVGGVLMAITAFWGYRSINRLSSLAVPLLLLLLVVGVVVAFIQHGTAGLDAQVEVTYTFGGAVSLVMGIFILGVVLSPDMARWAKTPKQAMAAGFVGFFFGNSIILVVAILLARVLNQTELMTMYFTLGMGGIAVVVLILAQWTTNTTNLYSAGLAFSSISSRLGRRTVTAVLAVIGIVIGVVGAADVFVSFILVIGTLIAPYGGVYLASFLTGRRTARWAHGATVPHVDAWSIIAWAAGVLVAFATTNPADGPGFGWFTITTISSLDGLLVGFAVYLLLWLVRGGRRADAAEAVPDARTDEVAA